MVKKRICPFCYSDQVTPDAKQLLVYGCGDCGERMALAYHLEDNKIKEERTGKLIGFKPNELKHAGESNWNIEIMIDCPHCDAYLDVEEDLLADHELCEPVKNVERECPECKKSFIFDVASGR